MQFERTNDFELVATILNHPDIYPHITDDNSPAVLSPTLNELTWYVAVRGDRDELLGLWLLVPQNSICWEVHTCLPKAAHYRDIGRQALEWLWANAPKVQRVVTAVPENNRAARIFAKRAGLIEYGCNPASFLKDGKLHDQILLGISRPGQMKEFLCQ